MDGRDKPGHDEKAGHFQAALAMLGYVLVGFPYSAAVYITALAMDFFTVTFSFLIATDVIMQPPMEVSERPAPH